MNNQFALTAEEESILAKIVKLKELSGSHSPSISTLKKQLPDIAFKVDACFLSNPYATDLFVKYLDEDIIRPGKLRALLEFYPAQNSEIAKDLGAAIGIDPANLFIANGASEAIHAVMNNFGGKKVAVVLPTFSPYYEFLTPGQEACYFILEEQDSFAFNVEKYLDFIAKENPDTVILINPNNPNGSYIPLKDMEHLLERLAGMKTIIVDESFIHFAFENKELDRVSIAEKITAHPNLVVVKSMSKDFGIAGIRAGYAVMDKERAAALLSRGYLWNSNGLAEYFVRLYARPEFREEYEPLRKQHIQDTQDFVQRMAQIKGISAYPSYGNYVLAKLPEGVSAQKVTVAMLNRYGIYLRDCADKKGLGPEYLRIASRTAGQNEQILNAFQEIFS